MIGTGVFFKAAIMSQQVGTPALVLAPWLTAGLMSLAPFAMSRDGLLARRFGEFSARARVPMWSVLAITAWSCILALSGTFDQLTDLTIFREWIFYGLTGAAVFVLRRKMPDAPRPYRTIFYPLTPLIFVACAAALILTSFSASPVEAMRG